MSEPPIFPPEVFAKGEYKLRLFERLVLFFRPMKVSLQLGDHGELHIISYKTMMGRFYLYKAMTVDKGEIKAEMLGYAKEN